jgi:HTH-type transcriptional regulator/antitoxin HigA
MDIKPLRTEADYEQALSVVARYFDQEPEPDSPEGDHFELLLMVIEAYESKHLPIDAPDPVEAIKFRMEQAGLTAKDLKPLIGQTNRVYEVLNYTRALTLPMIRRLNAALGIPADALIGEPKLRRATIKDKVSKRISAKSAKHAKAGIVTQAKSTGATKIAPRKTPSRKIASPR